MSVASGAAVLYKCAALRLVGLFDDAIFAYHEDVDQSWRMRLNGFRVVLAPKSIIKHRYEFSRSIKKFYFMERNRYWVHIKNLKLPTLLLLLPAFLLMEIGLWFYSFVGGWWREKLRAYTYLFSPKQLIQLWHERCRVQKQRTVPDRTIVRQFSSRILYQEIAHPLWEHVGNHFFAAYWFVVKRLIWW
jgi:GT2 family glycosyltransferase